MSAEGLNQVMHSYLRNIADGNWNVGREPDKILTVNEYAREALGVVGLDRKDEEDVRV